MRTKSTTRRVKTSLVSSQFLLSPASPSLSLSSPPFEFPLKQHPILARNKRKLGELSLQNTSLSSIAAKSVFINERGGGGESDIAEINNKSGGQKEEKVVLSSRHSKNCRCQAKIRVCGSGKLRRYTKIMVDRKTSTGSNSSQQSMSNESSSSTSNNKHETVSIRAKSATSTTRKRRTSSSTILRQILLPPNQPFSRYSGAKWLIQALPPTQNNSHRTNNRNKINQQQANVSDSDSNLVSTRRQLQKSMSVDVEDYGDSSIEDDANELDEEEFNADTGSEEELYWLNINRETNEKNEEDDVVDDEEYDDCDDDDDDGDDDGHSEEARIKGSESSLLPVNIVSGTRMMRRLTVSLPRHRERTSFMSHR